MKRRICTSIKIVCILIPIWHLVSLSYAQSALKVFYVGHSLSDRISEMVSSLSEADPSVNYDYRYQTIPGSPLRWSFQTKNRRDYHPIPPYIYHFDHPTQGLPAGDFDVLVLTESVPRYWAIIDETYQYADSFYVYFQRHNPGKRVYLYEVWHCLQSGNPTGCPYDVPSNPWRQRLSDDLSMWTSVLDTLHRRFDPDVPVYLIPGGQALGRLSDSIEAGRIPGISHISQLFSDDIHLTEQGAYFMACVHFATLHKKSPQGLPRQLYSMWGRAFDAPTQIQAEKYQQIAWELVTELSDLTGVGLTTPVAVIEADPLIGEAPLAVQFDGSNSISHSSRELSFSWDFGDGSTIVHEAQVQHIFQNPGEYMVVLEVSDGVMTSSTTVIITVRASGGSGGQCFLLANESFNYDRNTPLHNLNGGSGWGGSWRVQNQDITVPGYQIGDSPGHLSYLDLPVSGLYASGGHVWLTAGRLLNTDLNGPFEGLVDATESAIGGSRSGDSLWFSVLIRKTNNDWQEVYVDLTNSNIPECNSIQWCSDQRIAMGYFSDASNVGGERRWSVRVGEEVFPSEVVVNTEAASLHVLLLIFEENQTRWKYYINPTTLGEDGEPAETSLEGATDIPYHIRSIAYFSGSDPGMGAIDEIRFARSYACVAPDQNIRFNHPPVAIINASPGLIGQAPLSILFDGSQSFDPEGGVLTYEWDFGDGTTVSNLSIVQHTYTISGGQVSAKLRVRDPEGLIGEAVVRVSLLNDDGRLPCPATVSNLSMADCSGDGGHIVVYSEGTMSIELRKEGILINPAQTGDYPGLKVGVYQLNLSNNEGCQQTFDIHIRVDSTTCQGWTPAACSMGIGTNINGMADWEPHRPFRNFLKNTRGEPIPFSDECYCWTFDDPSSVLSQMFFDENGYPLSLPQSTSEGTTRLRYFVSAGGMNMQPGFEYLLLYDGIGDVSIHGSSSLISRQDGRIAFNLGGDGTFWFNINTSQEGNHIRNIRIIRPEDEFTDLEANPFYDIFIEKLAPFQNLRFMDWMRTNNNPLVSWSDRTRPGYFTYGVRGGAPYESIIQLANQTKKDIWICVPHAADDHYIRSMAQLFKDQLHDSIVIYLEYSNEVWNWIFEQAHYNVRNNPFGLNYGRAYAEKSKNVFRIWHEVFEGQKCRVKRVLGIQAGFNWLNEQILSQLSPDEWDYGSPTHYFGLDHGETGNPRLDVLGAAATVDDLIANARNHFAEFKESLKRDFRNIQQFGKEVITYEGGQHFVGNVFGIPYPYQQALYDVQNTQQMYQLYIDVMDSIRTWGCRLATNFSLAGPQENVYGSWGVLDHIDIEGPYRMTAPKYQALLDRVLDPVCIQKVKMEDLECLDIEVTIKEQSNQINKLHLYPNPGNNFLHVDYEGPRTQIFLFDLTGKMVASTTENILSVGHLFPGIYFVRVGNKVSKWIKM